MKFSELYESEFKIDTPEFKHLLTPGVTSLGNLFRKNNYDLRIVGGAVRDLVIGKEPKDIDFATDATPQEMIEIFEKNNVHYIPTGLQHGTITAVIDKEPFEITTLRVEREHTGRHATVDFTRSWEKDAERRDLTINAMSLGLDGTLYDYFDGVKDLKQGKIHFVGDPDQRIKEDYLRILRYFRFHGKFDKTEAEKETKVAIKRNADGLKQISGERIWMEIKQILSGKHTHRILEEMKELGVSQIIGLPVRNVNGVSIAKKHTNNPITILSVMLNTDAEVETLAKKWKWANPEKMLASFLVENKFNPFNFDIAQNMIVDKAKVEHVTELARIKGQANLVHRIENWQVPVFPVSGNDLLELGFKKGIELGNTLKTMRERWKQSRFTLSREDLLRTLQNTDKSKTK